MIVDENVALPAMLVNVALRVELSMGQKLPDSPVIAVANLAEPVRYARHSMPHQLLQDNFYLALRPEVQFRTTDRGGSCSANSARNGSMNRKRDPSEATEY